MQHYVRCGRRLPVPSTVQILHELKHFSAEEDVREECAIEVGLPLSAGWNDIYARRLAVGLHMSSNNLHAS